MDELIEQIRLGEDSRRQFKADVRNETSLAREIVAFSNSGGGTIFIGVGDDGAISGLVGGDMARINQILSNAASQQVRPPVNPQTENIATPEGMVMAVSVPAGISKPYMDKDGAIWVKSGADKRKATSREEIQRLYQSAGLIHGDEIPVPATSETDIDTDYFRKFFEQNFGELFDIQDISLAETLQNMNLMKDGCLNVSGTLLFAKTPYFRLPVFIAKAVAFPGNEIQESEYNDSRDITGKLESVFHESLRFILANIPHHQAGQGVNSLGKPAIAPIVLEELLANALIHRDYFVSAPVRIFVFRNRVEIISPGHLPNNLTIENIKSGNSNIRNPILASYAAKILPYRGLGSGIIRALKACPNLRLIDDREANLFKAVVPIPQA